MVFPTADAMRSKSRVYSTFTPNKELKYIEDRLKRIEGNDLLEGHLRIFMKEIEQACDGFSEDFSIDILVAHIKNFGYDVKVSKKIDGRVIKITIYW